jgi:hypothetical protein
LNDDGGDGDDDDENDDANNNNNNNNNIIDKRTIKHTNNRKLAGFKYGGTIYVGPKI